MFLFSLRYLNAYKTLKGSNMLEKAFGKNSQRLKAVSFFGKMRHSRSLTGF